MKLSQQVWGLSVLLREQLSPLLRSRYAECAIQIIGDPPGVQRQTDERTCFQLLENTVLMLVQQKVHMTKRLEAVRWWLSRR